MAIVKAPDSFRAGRPEPTSNAGFELFLTSVLTASQVHEAVDHARTTTITVPDALVALGFMTETRAYEALAEWAGLTFVNLDVAPPSPEAARLVPERVARAHQIIPIAQDNRTLTYASSMPLDADVARDVAFASGRRPQLVIAARSQVVLALNKAYKQGADIEALLARIQHASAVEPLEKDSSDGPTDSPIVDLCNRILGGAIAAGASDVHVEPSADGAIVRHRVCGILEPLLVLPASAVGRVTNRFKLMGKTDIATRFKPQDGAFRVAIDGATVDVRLSVLPTIHGEKLVMRVIHASSTLQTLETLGYDAGSIERLRGALSKPDGLVLVTGPTGSGKTTALYAALQYLRTGRVNIVTVEDPVERQVAGVTQIAINSKAGTSFASVLKSVMRQDPNIIMVGEIRDNEVAEIVGQAAYTGHLVLSSLHTTDAASAITRLFNLGLQPSKVAESLNAVVAQRLLRRLCTVCKVANDEETAKRMGAAHGIERIGATVGPGCPACKHTGYADRVAVPEVLVPDEALRTAIRDGAGAREIRAAMKAAGHPSMREYGIGLVAAGITSIDEINRVLTNHQDEPARVASPPAAAGPVVADAAVADKIENPRPVAARRILITDDDKMIRLLVRMLLQKEGFEVLEAANGAIGIDVARREHPDLMLVDLQMPDMNGFEAIEEIRKDITLGSMPIVVLTAETSLEVETKVLSMGADDYLVKPFEPEVLISRVRAAFRRYSEAAAA